MTACNENYLEYQYCQVLIVLNSWIIAIGTIASGGLPREVPSKRIHGLTLILHMYSATTFEA